ncbi:MAG: histidinol-phosphatase [Hyphomicrobium sp.]
MAGQTRNDDFKVILSTAHACADLSGPVILKAFRKRRAVENKAGSAGYDPVTAADRAAERVIAKTLKARFPAHGIVGEEYGVRGGAGPYRWIIDPIDGTRAFIMGSPMWGTLIGVLKDGAPYLGVMDQPFTGERFWSEAAASFLRIRSGPAQRIKTRPCATLKDAILTSTHPDIFETLAAKKTLAALKSQVRMTRYGGDCYGYGLLASGHIDLIVESGLKPYDIVALIPIIERAGGRISTWDGGTASNGGDIVAAGDPRLHEAAVKAISKS